MPEARTLYVSRPLKNVDDLRAWASAQGFELAADPHVTIAFSHAPLVWPDGIPDAPDSYTVEGGSRSVGGLGDQGAFVLRFESQELADRWQELKDAGASWDYDEYTPHVTLTYDAVDEDKIEPYDGPLEFGAEEWQPIKSKEERAMAKDGFYFLAQDSAEPVGPFPSRELAERAAALLSAPLASGLAQDKESVRVYDADGRMRLTWNPISKAAVNPYLGSEIPDWERLGLEPARVYMMLRDPEELAKGARTFDGIPILLKHEAVSADDPKRDIIAGCTGSGTKFEHPYLYSPLSIWTRDGIEGVETEQQKELSSAYRYRPDMTPGAWEGVKYDGVMRDIVGNHVALVEKGRAGPDVVVGDEAINIEETDMSKVTLSRTALRLSTALAVFAQPKLAADKALNLGPAFAKAGVSRKSLMAKDGKTFDPAKLKAVVKIARDAIDPLLTPEAKADGGIGPDDIIMHLLQQQAPAVAAEAPELDAAAGLPAPTTAAATGEEGEDGVDVEKVMALLASKGLDEAALAEVKALLGESAAPAAAPAAVADKPEPAAAGEEPAKDEDDEGDDDMVTKTAMDKALAASAQAIEKKMRQQHRETQEAIAFVRPYVGEVSMAHDTALDVYRATLDSLGVKGVETVKEPLALKAIIAAQPKPGDRKSSASVGMAADAASVSDFAKRFPHAARIGNLG